MAENWINVNNFPIRGSFNADTCTTPGLYQYISSGRAGLYTINDSKYSLLVMQTSSNGYRQIAFGEGREDDIYSRRFTMDGSTVTWVNYRFTKLNGFPNRINLNSEDDIEDCLKKFIEDEDNYSSFIITDANGQYPSPDSEILVSVDNINALNASFSGSTSVNAWLDNSQIYYKILGTYYSQTISNEDSLSSRQTLFNIGDIITFKKRKMTILDYFSERFKNINITDTLSSSDATLWNGWKLTNGYYTGTVINPTYYSDYNTILQAIRDGKFYTANSNPENGGTATALTSTDILYTYSYEIEKNPAKNNLFQNTIGEIVANRGRKIASGTFTETTPGETFLNTSNGNTYEFYAGWSSLDHTYFKASTSLSITSVTNESIYVIVDSFYRNNRNGLSNKKTHNAFITVSSDISENVTVPIKNLFDEEINNSTYTVPNDLSQADTAFDYGYYRNIIVIDPKLYNISATTLNVTIEGEFDELGSWCCFKKTCNAYVLDNTIISGGTIVGSTISGSTLAAPTVSATTLVAPTISGTTFKGTTISGTTLVGPTISGTTFKGTTISGTTLVGPTISGTTLVGPTISGTTFKGTTISGTTIECTKGVFYDSSGNTTTISGVNISTVTINADIISGATIYGNTFKGTTISGTTLVGPTVSGTTLVGPTVSGTTFKGTTISGTSGYIKNISGDTVSGLTISGFKGVFDDLSGNSTTISGGTIDTKNISGQTIVGTTISGTTLVGPTVSGTTLVGPTVSGTTLVGPTVSGTTLVGPTISGTTLVGPTISGTTLVGPTISGTTISGDTLCTTTIEAETVKGTTISGTTITGSTIDSVNGFYQTSDERLKTIEGEVNANLENITLIPKIYYSYKNDPNNNIYIYRYFGTKGARNLS